MSFNFSPTWRSKMGENINNNTEQIIGDTDTASLEEIKTISKYLEDIGAKIQSWKNFEKSEKIN